MNSPAIKRAKFCINLILLSLISAQVHAEWEVDFSRRRSPASEAPPPVISAPKEPLRAQINERMTATIKPLTPAAAVGAPEQEIVILNTDKGFIPRTVRVRQGGRYLIHVTNINSKEKNVSFMLDSFSENHATYFGEVKSFLINPQRDGVFSFQCPETSAQGEIVVFPSGDLKLRLPAQESAEPVVHITPIEPEH